MSKSSDSNDIDIHAAEKGDKSASDKASPEDSDGEYIYAMYLKRAEEEDERTAEAWKKEAEQVFLFTGLFSAVVATFISLSIQNVQADPRDTSNFYLASIHQALTGSGSNLSSISVTSSPPSFTPPTFGVWVNSLWFLSLVINMTCAVLANLLQQWSRKYLKVTQPRFTASEPRRARYHAYYADGVENFFLPWVFEALPALLHLSVFLFFAGLVIFLWNFVPTISKLILTWVGGCVILYGYITFIPIFRPDSPYNTPLSPLAWSIRTGIPYITLRVSEWVSYFLNIVLDIVSFIRWCLVILLCPVLCCLFCCLDDVDFLFVDFGIDLNRLAEAGDRHRKLFFQGMQKSAERAALGLQAGFSRRAFMWTFHRSHEDEELERFFSNLPGFSKSNDEEDFLTKLTGNQKENLWSGLVGFLDRTFSSDLLREDKKSWRAKICADAIKVDPLAALSYILESVISEDQCAPVQSVGLAPFIGRLDIDEDIVDPMLTQSIVSCVVATARHNDEWFTIAPDELGVDEPVLRSYTAPERSDLSLAILIHVTCQQLHNFKDASWQCGKFSKVLRAASKFKVQQASPQLQNAFCSLWNQILNKAHDDEDGDGPKIARFILRPIYKIYVDIHQRSHLATGAAGSGLFARTHARTTEVAGILKNPREYLPCTDDAHLLDMTSLIPNGNNDTTLITLAGIIALPHTDSETTPAPALVTTPPGASPVISPATEKGAAAEGDELRSSSLPSLTDSKGADAGRSLEPDVGHTGGDHSPPLSHHGLGDNMV